MTRSRQRKLARYWLEGRGGLPGVPGGRNHDIVRARAYKMCIRVTLGADRQIAGPRDRRAVKRLDQRIKERDTVALRRAAPSPPPTPDVVPAHVRRRMSGRTAAVLAAMLGVTAAPRR